MGYTETLSVHRHNISHGLKVWLGVWSYCFLCAYVCIWMCMGVCVGMVFCDLSCHNMKEGVPRWKLYVEMINSFLFFMTLLVLSKISFYLSLNCLWYHTILPALININKLSYNSDSVISTSSWISKITMEKPWYS